MRSPYAARTRGAILLDLACFGVAAIVAWLTTRPAFSLSTYAFATTVGAACAVLALSAVEAYKPVVLGSAGRTLRCVVMSMGLALVAAVVIYFAVPLPEGALPPLARAAAVFFPLVVIGRWTFRMVSRRHARRLAVMGTSDLGLAIARQLVEHRGAGIDFVGFVANDDAEAYAVSDRSLAGFPILGTSSRIEKILSELRIDWVVVASEDLQDGACAEALLAAKLRGLRVDAGHAFYEGLTGRVLLPESDWRQLLFADRVRPRRVSSVAKRCLDLVLASVGLVLTSPLVALAAVAIRLDSPGPIFFRQARVGKGGGTFHIVKLRSMRHGAEQETGPRFTSNEDERVTRVGRVLRPIHLDEIPQLWNVITDQMSLIGPRPERPEFVEAMTDRVPLFRYRAGVKPGVTGWAQIRDGYAGDLAALEQKFSFDLFYLMNRSLALDLRILWETVKEVLHFRGT
jgi:exopolysaccharide biosynthesis polyprenyl glycosylphosphotransferase